jgi:hypothetical protein
MRKTLYSIALVASAFLLIIPFLSDELDRELAPLAILWGIGFALLAIAAKKEDPK